jgi:23S rRNA G2445 N2-methylase RlmL
MVNLLFMEDSKALAGQKPIRSIYDPACGTGGMLSIAEEYLHDLNPNIKLNVFGQELNPETWAIARSDLMIKGQVERRMRKSSVTVGSAWYTCWVNAGKPNLNKIGEKTVSDSLLLAKKKEEELYQQRKEKNIKGHDD